MEEEEEFEINTSSKVGRVLSERGLFEFHDTLPKRWRGEEGYTEHSYRDLARLINIRVVREAASQHMNLVDGGAENIYDFLTSDNPDVRIQQEQKLKDKGVDVDQLHSDFISHQTVYRYLKTQLGLTKDESTESEVEEKLNHLMSLRSRAKLVIKERIKKAQSDGNVSITDISPYVSFQVYCDGCNRNYDVVELLERGACHCGTEGEGH